MNRQELLQLARAGAEARIAELQAEIDRIRRQFPSGRRTPANGAAGTVSPRKRRRMSAAARKRISDAQKSRWAKQRAQEATKKQ